MQDGKICPLPAKGEMNDWMGRAGGDSETVDFDASWFWFLGKERKTWAGV